MLWTACPSSRVSPRAVRALNHSVLQACYHMQSWSSGHSMAFLLFALWTQWFHCAVNGGRLIEHVLWTSCSRPQRPGEEDLSVSQILLAAFAVAHFKQKDSTFSRCLWREHCVMVTHVQNDSWYHWYQQEKTAVSIASRVVLPSFLCLPPLLLSLGQSKKE